MRIDHAVKDKRLQMTDQGLAEQTAEVLEGFQFLLSRHYAMIDRWYLKGRSVLS